MIYIAYIIVAFLVMAFSVKASYYVDEIEQKSTFTGAFVGGIMLSAVTSLPELFTSLSSAVLLGKPGLCMGNILGSDLFNLAVLAILILIFFKSFSKAYVSNAHFAVALCICFIYLLLFLYLENVLSFQVASVSVISVLIAVAYSVGVKCMSLSEDAGEDGLPVKKHNMVQLYIRFAVVSLGIIVVSIIITYITDVISRKLNIGSGLAGAIFLGIATSLPEVCSTFTLFKMHSYDIAVGNIIGSNIFNFLILTIVDLVYNQSGIYSFSDPQTVRLLFFGWIATVLFLIMFKLRQRRLSLIFTLCIIGCYLGFLLM